MSRSALRTPLLCGAALLVAVWVANASHAALMTGHPRPPDTSSQIRDKQFGLVQMRPKPHKDLSLFWLEIVWYVGLGALALAIVALLVLAVRSHERRTRTSLTEAPESPDAFSALLVPAALVESAEQQLALLRQGLPRNAIVACWVALETSCSETGLPREASETSSEFTERVLSKWVVDRERVLALAALYREARFSVHEMSEVDRAAAVHALEAILASLRASRPRLAGAGSTR